MHLKPSLACTAVLLVTGCGSPASEGGFDSPNPATRLYAIERAAKEGDVAATPRLVEQLDSDDPAVRLMAIAALQALTGETYDYRYDDPPYLREAAIKRWIEALESSPPSRTMNRPKDDDE